MKCLAASFKVILLIFIFGLFMVYHFFGKAKWSELNKIRGFLENAKRIGLTRKERAIFLDLLSTLDTICTRHNLTYFLFAGSLLGQARMERIIPWDDDMDVAMDIQDLIKFIRIVSNNTKGYTTLGDGRSITKFFSSVNYTVKHARWPWKWPFIDIFPYHYVKTGDGGKGLVSLAEMTYEPGVIFPLHKVPFEGMRIPAPNQSRRFLQIALGKDVFRICQISHYDHRREMENFPQKISVKCEHLLKYYNINL